MADRNLKLTEGEWAIIRTVWENEPCAAPTVQEKLEARRKWTYSTVKTMMDRMVGKGLLSAERIRNLTLYRSAVTAKDARKGEIRGVLTRAFNGALTPMMQFMLDNHRLSNTELDELEALIKQKRRTAKR